MLGICRGHQLINALLGGMLTQDIKLEYPYKDHPHYHPLDHIETGSLMDLSFPKKRINSLHHQAVTVSGEGLRPTSAFNDVFESTEGERVFSVQGHPEMLQQECNFFDVSYNWIKGD